MTGIVRLRFTSNLEDTTGASDIPVIPLLLRYNAVVFTSLPLDATLLGLDPVRLPADGRVPVSVSYTHLDVYKRQANASIW